MVNLSAQVINAGFLHVPRCPKRPAIVNGRRKFVDVETIWAFNQWGSTTTTINIADMLNEEYWIMRFDENGNPDWTDPQAPATPEV